MKSRLFFAFLAVLGFALTACAMEPQDSLNAEAFNAHFSNQRKCAAYVDSLVRPVAKELAAKKSIEEMRSWLRDHSSEKLARLVAMVQARTLKGGALNPRLESDQLRVTSVLHEEMSKLAGFDQSACGPDVREAVMESIYLAIGGEKAFVAEQLRRSGISENSKQRWVLLAALMAGELAPGSI